VRLQAAKAASAKAKLGSTAGDKSGKSPAVSRDQVLRRWIAIDIVRTAPLPYQISLFHSWLRGTCSVPQSSASLAELQNGIGKFDISPTENGAGADSAHGRTVTGPQANQPLVTMQPYTLDFRPTAARWSRILTAS
jgi:hypothetical protein